MPSRNTSRPATKRGSIALWLTVFVALVAVVLGVSISRGNISLFSSNAQDSPAAVADDIDVTETAEPQQTDTITEVMKKTESTAASEEEEAEQADMSKTSWLELVGVDGETAKATVEAENPSLSQVIVIPDDAMVTSDYREDRVRIFVDGEGKVARAPTIG